MKTKIKSYSSGRLSKGAKVLIGIALTLELAIAVLFVSISKNPNLLNDFAPETEPIAEEPIVQEIVEEVPVEVDTYTMDTILVTTKELDMLDSEGTFLLLNEIYARNGFIFGATDLQAHFDSQDWYIAETTDMEAVYAKMTYTEKQNIEIIVEYQKEHGYR